MKSPYNRSRRRRPHGRGAMRLSPARGTVPATVTALLWCAAAGATDVVSVDTTRVLLERDVNPVGININYLRDDDHNRPANACALHAAMKEMGVVWVRYPGGEKSDWHMFARPPFARPDPQTFGWYAPRVRDSMDFDEFIRCVRGFGGRPVVVVPYDSLKRTGKTRKGFLEHAVAWVRYANVTRRYGVRHWEIGNENWHNGTASADEMGRIAAEFAQAMKAVDPTIHVGTSGNRTAWFKTVLDAAGEHLDFLTVSNYRGWTDGFDRYRRTPRIALDGPARNAERAIDASPYRDRMKVIVAEFNAVDFKKRWPPRNDLGHAIVSFDIAGQLILRPRVECAMLWTTRWMDAEKPDSMWYALGPHNEIRVAGRPLAIWGRFLKPAMVSVTTPSHLVGYASSDRHAGALTVFIINKREASTSVDLRISPHRGPLRADIHRFSGTGDADVNPTWRGVGSRSAPDGRVLPVNLPGTSITVIDLAPDTSRR